MNLTVNHTYDNNGPLRGPKDGIGYPPTEVESLRRKNISVMRDDESITVTPSAMLPDVVAREPREVDILVETVSQATR